MIKEEMEKGLKKDQEKRLATELAKQSAEVSPTNPEWINNQGLTYETDLTMQHMYTGTTSAKDEKGNVRL